jgi:hypothetical protein
MGDGKSHCGRTLVPTLHGNNRSRPCVTLTIPPRRRSRLWTWFWKVNACFSFLKQRAESLGKMSEVQKFLSTRDGKRPDTTIHVCATTVFLRENNRNALDLRNAPAASTVSSAPLPLCGMATHRRPMSRCDCCCRTTAGAMQPGRARVPDSAGDATRRAARSNYRMCAAARLGLAAVDAATSCLAPERKKPPPGRRGLSC